MNDDIIEITGTREGPTSVIIAGVHGDEKSGVLAFLNMLSTLKIKFGTVFFICGNPQAIKLNTRFTEANLNRMFKSDELLRDTEKTSYEYLRAQTIKTYLDKSEALLDIHCSFTPQSKPFIICESNGYGIASCLPVDLTVSGFDKVEPGGTDYYMNINGKIGICIECGYLGDESSITIAEQSIDAFLKTRGHIKESVLPNKQNRITMYSLYITKTESFVLNKPFEDFAEIKKGELIGYDGQQPINAGRDSIILFARNRSSKNEEAFLLGEYVK